MVYGQTEVTRDLMDAAHAGWPPTVYEAADVSLHGFDGNQPQVVLARRRGEHVLTATSSPAATVSTASRAPACRRRDHRVREGLPFGWLGILADTPPVNARAHLRQHRARVRAVLDAQPTRSRYYAVQPERPRGAVERRRLLDELRAPRPGGARAPGHRARRSRRASRRCAASWPSPCASVACSCRRRRPHRAADRGQGPEPAATDVQYLSQGLIEHYRDRSDAGLDRYSGAACAASGGQNVSPGGSLR